MRIPDLTLTPALTAWLASRGDGAQLTVRQDGAAVVVTRVDGSEPLPHEARRVEGIVAAHRAEPFTSEPSKKN